MNGIQTRSTKMSLMLRARRARVETSWSIAFPRVRSRPNTGSWDAMERERMEGLRASRLWRWKADDILYGGIGLERCI